MLSAVYGTFSVHMGGGNHGSPFAVFLQHKKHCGSSEEESASMSEEEKGKILQRERPFIIPHTQLVTSRVLEVTAPLLWRHGFWSAIGPFRLLNGVN
jgi:hypothetical protein